MLSVEDPWFQAKDAASKEFMFNVHGFCPDARGEMPLQGHSFGPVKGVVLSRMTQVSLALAAAWASSWKPRWRNTEI